MRVLIACESSGVVRDAFTRRGHNATSCDLQPSESPLTGRHYQGNVFDIMHEGWDLVIAHPPCTFLCGSGMHWTTRGLRSPQLTEDAAAFFMAFAELDCMWCIENPVGVMSTRYRKPDQYIQPYQFGHDASKKTGLWLSGLGPLTLDPDQYVEPRIIYKNVKAYKRWANQTDSGQNRLGPSENRWKERSKTFPGIAAAMAEQWG